MKLGICVCSRTRNYHQERDNKSFFFSKNPIFVISKTIDELLLCIYIYLSYSSFLSYFPRVLKRLLFAFLFFFFI